LSSSGFGGPSGFCGRGLVLGPFSFSFSLAVSPGFASPPGGVPGWPGAPGWPGPACGGAGRTTFPGVFTPPSWTGAPSAFAASCAKALVARKNAARADSPRRSTFVVMVLVQTRDESIAATGGGLPPGATTDDTIKLKRLRPSYHVGSPLPRHFV